MLGEKSLLFDQRHLDLPPKERERIFACERTAHELTLITMAEAHGSLESDRASTAVIVGVFTALCRLMAQAKLPRATATVLATMLPKEVQAWEDR